MPSKLRPSPALERLKGLSGPAQIALAVEIVEAEKDARAVRAAVDVLREHPTWEAKPALLKRYAALAADGIKRDAGTYLRTAILRALRPLAQPSDVPLLEAATATYEYLPPTRSEEAGQLRSAALVVLNEVDSDLAGYHAVRLLNDPETSPLSGEPSLTAARLLASQGNRQALYAYLVYQSRFKQPPPPLSEVISECLKSLAGMPESLLPGVIERYQDSEDEIVLVGLVDLALGFGEQPAAAGFLTKLLSETQQYAVYRYVTARLVTDHDARFLPVLERLAREDTDPRRRALLEEALLLGAGDPNVRAALEALRGAEAAHGGKRPAGRRTAKGKAS